MTAAARRRDGRQGGFYKSLPQVSHICCTRSWSKAWLHGTTGLKENQSKHLMTRRGVAGTAAEPLKCGEVKIKEDQLDQGVSN